MPQRTCRSNLLVIGGDGLREVMGRSMAKNCPSALPFGQPALFAARTKPVVLAHPGDDRERRNNERDFLRSHSFPRCALLEGAEPFG